MFIFVVNLSGKQMKHTENILHKLMPHAPVKTASRETVVCYLTTSDMGFYNLFSTIPDYIVVKGKRSEYESQYTNYGGVIHPAKEGKSVFDQNVNGNPRFLCEANPSEGIFS